VEDIVVGILAIAVGALFCFRGFFALRVIIPIWGAFAGFALGAGWVANTSDDGFLRTGLSWVVGLVVGLLFGLFAYLYYEVSVVLAMGAIGFTLGTGAMVALGISWSWLVVLAGLALGALLAVFAVVGNVPGFVLALVSALAGAVTIVAGAMLLTGVVDTAEFTSASVTERLEDDWWWYALYAGLAIVGLVAQLREVERIRQSLRESWVEAGGRELRPR
jgi:hypothetical protein